MRNNAKGHVLIVCDGIQLMARFCTVKIEFGIIIYIAQRHRIGIPKLCRGDGRGDDVPGSIADQSIVGGERTGTCSTSRYGYEIIAGHRRKHGAKRAGLKRVPIDIRDVDDDTATLMMVNTNVQREKVLPSERAFAYKMMLEAIKRQGARNDLTSSQVGTKSRMDDLVASSVGISRNQIQRYIRLTHLTDVLLTLVDKGKLPFNTGVELSYLRANEQDVVFNIMNNDRIKPTISQAVRLKEESRIHEMTQDEVAAILLVEKDTDPRIKLSPDIFSIYFDGYTQQEAEKVVLDLLFIWKQKEMK